MRAILLLTAGCIACQAAPPKFLAEPFAARLDPEAIAAVIKKVSSHYSSISGTADSTGGQKLWEAGLEASQAVLQNSGTTERKTALGLAPDEFGALDGQRKTVVDLLCAWSELASLHPDQRWTAPGFKIVASQANRGLCASPDFVNACIAVHAVAWPVNQNLGIMITDYYRVPALEGWVALLSNVGEDGKIRGDEPEPMFKAGAFLLAAQQVMKMSKSMVLPQACARSEIYQKDRQEQQMILSKATLPSAAQTKAIMRRACAWQAQNLAHGGEHDTSWQRGAFGVGLVAAYKATNDEWYLQLALDLAEKNQFKPGPRAERPHGADDLGISQVYLDLCLLDPPPEITGKPGPISMDIVPTRQALDTALKHSSPTRFEWYWVDALFMGPPTWARMAQITGERKYLDHMNLLWWQTVDKLWDPEAGLVYRDRTYIPQASGLQLREINGEKVFWGRGNGWFAAALYRVLESLPKEDPERPRYEAILKTQLASLVKLQGREGLWTTSLLDPKSYPMGDNSCSTFFCYAMAWGLNHGLVEAKTFLPPTLKAWAAITACVDQEGRLCYVQEEADSTRAKLSKNSTREYGTGAMLLAGAEILKLPNPTPTAAHP